MQLPCYQTRESPSSGKCRIFCYRLTYISKMCSMHHNNLKLSGQIVSNPPEKSHRCEAYVCCCPIFGHRQCIRCPGVVIGSVLDVRAWSQVCELFWYPCSHYSMLWSFILLSPDPMDLYEANVCRLAHSVTLCFETQSTSFKTEQVMCKGSPTIRNGGGKSRFWTPS